MQKRTVPMKGNRWTSVKVLCPYYKAQTTHEIICVGLEPNSNIHLSYASPDQRKAYEECHCMNDYQKCMVFQIKGYGQGYLFQR